MATIFRNLFRNKKSKDETPEINERRSMRSSTTSKNRSARFSDDHMLPATAAYHTTNAPKLRKGPQSCPGAYAPPQPQPDSTRRRRHPTTSIASSSGSRRDWAETSEYGSESLRGDSPRHHYQNYHGRGGAHQQQHQHRHHYEMRLDRDDGEEEEEEDEHEMSYENKKYQDLKHRYRRHYEDKLNDYECRRRDDRRKIKELEKEKQVIEKEKNDVVKIMIQQNEKMEKEKKKCDYYRRKMLEMEQQLNQMRGAAGGFASSFAFQPSTPQIFATGAFGTSSVGSGANSGRFSSFLSNSIRPISSSNTPTTSAMDTSTGGGGAGESLVPASDLSLIQIPPMAPIIDLPQNVPTGGIIGGGFAEFEDIEEDEIKNFRTADTPSLSLEMPRISDVSAGCSFLNGKDEDALLEETDKIEIRDEGYSTTPDEAQKA